MRAGESDKMRSRNKETMNVRCPKPHREVLKTTELQEIDKQTERRFDEDTSHLPLVIGENSSLLDVSDAILELGEYNKTHNHHSRVVGSKKYRARNITMLGPSSQKN